MVVAEQQEPMAVSGAVDVHAHITDPVALRAMTRRAPEFVPELEDRDGTWFMTFPNGRTRSVATGLLDVHLRLADMDARGIAYQALSSFSNLYLYDPPGPLAAELLALQNDSIVAVARAHPERFVAMAGLPLQDVPLSLLEIERLAPLPEIAGIQICTNVTGRNLDDEAFEPVWAALEAHDLAVLVHPYGPGPVGKERMSRYHLVNLIGNPLETAIAIASVAFSGILERYPRLRFGFVHGGGFMPYQLGRWDHGWATRPESKERLGRPPSEIVGGMWFDSLTHDPRSLRFLGERFGWSRVVIGTDYPWAAGTSTPLQDLRAAGLSGPDLEQVAVRSPRDFLRWPEQKTRFGAAGGSHRLENAPGVSSPRVQQP
jgi:aminocarboxymuconate-semialdehyde decarboxylase